METKHAYFIMVVALAFAGIALIALAIRRKQLISLTATSNLLEIPMKISHVNLVGKNLTGEAAAGPPNDSNSVVLARYRYELDGHEYESRSIFPLEVEWMQPRISPLILFEELKSGSRRVCYVNPKTPQYAYMFVGWSPYLKRHVFGLSLAGIALLMVSLFFAFVA